MKYKRSNKCLRYDLINTTPKSFLVAVLLVLSFVPVFIFAQTTSMLPDPGMTPDGPFYFLKTWKEQIQLFFTFDTEQKAKQYLHLAEVRLAEYQKLIEKKKTEIAERTLQKYEHQLNQALEKAEELKNKDKNKAEEVKNKIEESIFKHLQFFQENLANVPETARKGLGKAIEASQKSKDKLIKEKIDTINNTNNWKTYRNEQYGFEFGYPSNFFISVENKKEIAFFESFYQENSNSPLMKLLITDDYKNFKLDTGIYEISSFTFYFDSKKDLIQKDNWSNEIIKVKPAFVTNYGINVYVALIRCEAAGCGVDFLALLPNNSVVQLIGCDCPFNYETMMKNLKFIPLSTESNSK